MIKHALGYAIRGGGMTCLAVVLRLWEEILPCEIEGMVWRASLEQALFGPGNHLFVHQLHRRAIRVLLLTF